MSQRRNPSRVVNGSNRNLSISDCRPRTLVSRNSNESILSERLILVVFLLLPRIENDVKKEHKKEESIDSKNVNV